MLAWGKKEKGTRNRGYRTGRQPKTLQGAGFLASGDLVSFVFALGETKLSCHQPKKKKKRKKEREREPAEVAIKYNDLLRPVPGREPVARYASNPVVTCILVGRGGRQRMNASDSPTSRRRIKESPWLDKCHLARRRCRPATRPR